MIIENFMFNICDLRIRRFTMLLKVCIVFVVVKWSSADDLDVDPKKEQKESGREREFLFNRPQVPGAFLGLPGPSLFGSPSFNGLTPSSNFQNPLIGRPGVGATGLSNPLLGGIGSNPGFPKQVIGGLGSNPLIGNPLLNGNLGLNSHGQDQFSKHILNQIKSGNSPLLNRNNFLHRTFLNPHQQDFMKRHQLQQLPHLGFLNHLQDLPSSFHSKQAGNLLQSSSPNQNDDRFMELLILQYLLGNDNVRDVLGPGSHKPFSPLSARSNSDFGRTGSHFVDSPVKRRLGSSERRNIAKPFHRRSRSSQELLSVSKPQNNYRNNFDFASRKIDYTLSSNGH